MKITTLTIIAVFTLSLVASAQNRQRVFDNFDATNGVNVVTPAVKPLVSSKPVNSNSQNTNTTVSKVKKTASVESGLGLNARVNGSSVPSLHMGTGLNLGEFTTGDAEIDGFIVNASRKYGIDPLLIYSQMHQESAFKLKARSYKGASGLMQLMPATAKRFGVTNIYDPQQNIEAGVRYMRWLLNKFDQDIVLALAGYNAGEGAVMKYDNQVPPYRETQEYVRRITSRYRSISNPRIMKDAISVNNVELAKLEKNEQTKSLKLYEQSVITVKLPDGRLRLVTN
ncbi:MAG: lytic transglycosylase domain-containing protein [Pyrinomonadaceae bacterium]